MAKKLLTIKKNHPFIYGLLDLCVDAIIYSVGLLVMLLCVMGGKNKVEATVIGCLTIILVVQLIWTKLFFSSGK